MSTPRQREAGIQLAREMMREALASPAIPPVAGLHRKAMKALGTKFAPSRKCVGRAAQDGRGDQAYWIDHGRCTGALMRRMARRWGGDPELYYRVGFVHDLDYLRFPHDAGKWVPQDENTHPVPLAFAMRELGVHPAVILAVLEHAPYLGLDAAPSSRLSAALSAAEDLVTMASLEPASGRVGLLSKDARGLLSTIRIGRKIHRKGKVRVETDPDRYVNSPLALVIEGGGFSLDI